MSNMSNMSRTTCFALAKESTPINQLKLKPKKYLQSVIGKKRSTTNEAIDIT
jgi:hypothetical protein